MKTARVSVCLAILLCGVLSSPLFAQGLPPGGGSYGLPPTGQAGVTDAPPDSYDIFDNRRFQFRTDFGDGVGYAKGFQTFGAFQPIIIDPDDLILFLNPRGIVTYTGELAANGGAGARWYDRGSDRIWGLSAWYDYDNTGDNKYDQIGASFESLGQYLDVRANTYILTHGGRDFIGRFLTGQQQFIGNNIGIGQISTYDNPLSGGDFEIGGALPGIGDIGGRAYAGGYYYQGDGTGAVYGVRGRAEALITQDLWGTVIVTHDKLFGTNVTGAFTWYLGSGQQARWFQRIPMQDRMWQQVERQYRIAVWREQQADTVLALRNGGTGGSGGPAGTPIFVVHVDNTAGGGGDGTAEHPLNFLPTTTGSNVDIVFVHRGNGTSTNMNNGITLNSFQRLLGQGVQHLFNSQQGTFVLPGYSPGVLPSITNPAGDVVTLASFNEVSGFRISGGGRHGITGTGIDSFNINNVNVFNNGDGLTHTGAGIAITNASGVGQVFDATLTANAADGMRIDNTGTTLSLAVNRVTADANFNGIALVETAGSTMNVTMADTTADNNQHDGIIISATAASTFNGLFDRITANSNNVPQVDVGFGNGMTVTANASTVNLEIQHSTFNNNNLNGVSVVGTNASIVNLAMLNNNSTISNNLQSGLFYDITDSTGNVVLQNNIFNNNGAFGAFVQATNGSLAFVAGGLGTEDINGNGVLDPGEDANGNGLFDRQGNTFDANHGAAIAYTLRDAATGTIDIRGNLITRTLNDTGLSTIYNGQGIDVRLTGSTGASNATAILTSGIIDRNTIGSLTDATLGNAGAGMVVFADQLTTLSNVTVGNTDGVANNGNLVANNAGIGINFERRNQAIVNNILIQDNRVSLNTLDGVAIIAANTANDLNDYTMQSNVITNNGNATNLQTAGVRLRVEADAHLSVSMFDNLISNNVNDGVLTVEQVNLPTDQRFVTGVWDRNTITNNGQNGIHLTAASSALVIGSSLNNGNTITGNLGTGPGSGQGIRISGAGTGSIGFNNISNNNGGGIYVIDATFKGWTITSNSIVQNNGDGLRIVQTFPGGIAGGAGVFVDAESNIIRDNAQRGVNILNGGDVTTTVILNGNNIFGNGFEGIRVVNTAVDDPLQADLVPSAPGPTLNLPATGLVTRNPVLFLTVTNNNIEGNGRFSTAGTSNGLVILVGSAGGGYTFTDNGGFFAGGTRAGVGATVTGNSFSGNFGDDFLAASYVSTVDPVATTGTWTNVPPFAVTPPFQGDPLSRLDMLWADNTFEAITQATFGGAYTNAEPTFKSRDITQVDPGPFQNGGRPRNVQRLAGRFGLPPATPGGASNTFLYSGIGTSTFRLMNGSDTGDFAGVIDVQPYTNPLTDAAGFLIAPGPLTTMPWGWSLE